MNLSKPPNDAPTIMASPVGLANPQPPHELYYLPPSGVTLSKPILAKEDAYHRLPVTYSDAPIARTLQGLTGVEQDQGQRRAQNRTELNQGMHTDIMMRTRNVTTRDSKEWVRENLYAGRFRALYNVMCWMTA